MNDFVKALDAAQTSPGGPGTAAQNFDPFNPHQPATEVVAEPAQGRAAFPGATRYNVTYHSQRFYMGRELQEVTEDGAKIYSDRDESEAYADIMRKVAAGEALIAEKLKTILSDGSIVIWLEWMVTAPKPAAKAPEDVLPYDVLLGPERVTTRSKEQDAKSDASELSKDTLTSAARMLAQEAGLPLREDEDAAAPSFTPPSDDVPMASDDEEWG